MKYRYLIIVFIGLNINLSAQVAPHANFDASGNSYIDLGVASDLNNYDVLDEHL